MKKTVVRIICFAVLLALALGGWNAVFRFKHVDGIYSVKEFYEQGRDTVDLLILGSSHAFEDFNTGTLWDEHGIASYVMGGSVQPMWNTYYYLKEALKTQSPKLIILEAYCTILDGPYIDDSRIIKNNYGLHWSADKFASLAASAPEERQVGFLLEYAQYHARYRELSDEDFLPDLASVRFGSWKGFGANLATEPHQANSTAKVTSRTRLSQKTEQYYRLVIQLAKDSGIPILVVVTPYAGLTVSDQRRFNRAADVAADLEVPFINCNGLTEEMGIDYAVDAADWSHLNYRGNQKFTHWIGAYITEHYELPDRRGDPRYASWQEHADYIRRETAAQEMRECTRIDDLLPRAAERGWEVVVSIGSGCTTSYAKLQDFLSALGIHEHRARGIWLSRGGVVLWSAVNEPGVKYFSTPGHDFCLRNGADGLPAELNVDGTDVRKTQNEMDVIVYDPLSDMIVDVFGIDTTGLRNRIVR